MQLNYSILDDLTGNEIAVYFIAIFVIIALLKIIANAYQMRRILKIIEKVKK